MDINIEVKVGGKGKGLMGASLEEITGAVIKKKKKKKRKSPLMAAIESVSPKKSKYTTEVI